MPGSQTLVWADVVDEEGRTVLYGYHRVGQAAPGREMHIGDKHYLVIDVDHWMDRRTDCLTITVRTNDNG